MALAVLGASPRGAPAVKTHTDGTEAACTLAGAPVAVVRSEQVAGQALTLCDGSEAAFTLAGAPFAVVRKQVAGQAR